MQTIFELDQWANACESDLRFHEFDELSVDGACLKSRANQWKLDENGYSQICESVGAPAAYLQKLNLTRALIC